MIPLTILGYWGRFVNTLCESFHHENGWPWITFMSSDPRRRERKSTISGK
jgi:hypothetical protein